MVSSSYYNELLKLSALKPKQCSEGGDMVTDWITAVGVVTVFGIVGVVMLLRSSAGNDLLPPWEAYHRAFNDAQAARGQFLRSGFLVATRSLKDRICHHVRKWHIPLCPLCCAAK
jgi:hypothetical protein